MIKHLIRSDQGREPMYLVKWGPGREPFVFSPDPREAHRFNTRGEADAILGLIISENWPGYVSKIIAANVRPAKKSESDALFD